MVISSCHVIYCVAMHQLFQKDLFLLKLDTARSYVKSLATSMAPMVTGHGGSYNISAQVIIYLTKTHNCVYINVYQVQGIGPLFNLTVSVENLSQKQTALNLCLVFQWDEALYSLSKKIIKV